MCLLGKCPRFVLRLLLFLLRDFALRDYATYSFNRFSFIFLPLLHTSLTSYCDKMSIFVFFYSIMNKVPWRPTTTKLLLLSHSPLVFLICQLVRDILTEKTLVERWALDQSSLRTVRSVSYECACVRSEALLPGRCGASLVFFCRAHSQSFLTLWASSSFRDDSLNGWKIGDSRNTSIHPFCLSRGSAKSMEENALLSSSHLDGFFLLRILTYSMLMLSRLMSCWARNEVVKSWAIGENLDFRHSAPIY